MPELAINGRFSHQQTTGIQRVASSITARLRTPHFLVAPHQPCEAVRGHLWEQFVLPVRARGRLLWGPCNTGPLIQAKQILTIHGAAVFDHPEWFSPSFVRMNHTLWPILAKRALKIVTVSYFSRDRISEVLSIPKSQIEVIWNGVDEAFHPASAETVDQALSLVGIKGRRYFASLSTIEPRKNLSLILKAWEKAKSKVPADFVLLVIGGKGKSGVFGTGAIDAAADLDRVVFSGYVPEETLPALLSGACAVLYPSIYEGFGLPVLEAMACGAPVVTTRQTSLPEVGGDAALYVHPDDPHDLASTLISLSSSEDLRRERSAMGLERSRLFSWNTAAARMDEIFARYL